MSLNQEKVFLSLQQLALFILTAERNMPTSSPKKLQNVMRLEQREELGFDGYSDLGLNKWKNRPERIPTTTLNQLFTYYHYTFKLLNVLSEVMGLQCSPRFSKLT